MKKVLIEQFGEEGLRLCRRFYVEIPDDMDVVELEDGKVSALVEVLADDLNLDWEIHDSTGVFLAELTVIEPEANADGSDEYPLLKISTEDIAAEKGN